MSTQIELIDKLREKLLIEKIPSYPVGFLTQDKRFFPISSDTKLLSKILEITLMGYLRETIENELTEWGVGFCEAQNQYPDFFLFNHESKEMIAIDFKSTYLKDETTISGFTLGAFNGYFKNQEKRMCCYSEIDGIKKRLFYKDFIAHYVICIIYERLNHIHPFMDEIRNFEDLENSISKISNFISIKFIGLTPKWRVASSRPGSGNTANIGSINNFEQIRKGIPFFQDENQFIEYWIYFLNQADALKRIRKIHKDFVAPYNNFEQYTNWVKAGRPNLSFYKQILELF